MDNSSYKSWTIAALVLLSHASFAEQPKRDLTVELRQIEEGREDGVSYRAGPSKAAPLLVAQKIQVRNGEKGLMRMNLSVPMQWVQSVQAPMPQQSASGTHGAGVSQSMTWFDVGQTLSVQPRWPGSNKDAVLELEIEQSSMQAGIQSDLPAQSRSRFSTTVTAPLAQWVTVAASGGGSSKQGSYSSQSNKDVRRLLQIRVLVP
jgi:hypothetical protein